MRLPRWLPGHGDSTESSYSQSSSESSSQSSQSSQSTESTSQSTGQSTSQSTSQSTQSSSSHETESSEPPWQPWQLAGAALAGRLPPQPPAGLVQVALTRAALPVPILLVPPFLLDALAAAPVLGAAMARSGGVKLGVELAVFACFLQGALPFAVALFPQTGRIAAADLEPQFRGRVSAKTGKPVEFYTYNKGV